MTTQAVVRAIRVELPVVLSITFFPDDERAQVRVHANDALGIPYTTLGGDHIELDEVEPEIKKAFPLSGEVDLARLILQAKAEQDSE